MSRPPRLTSFDYHGLHRYFLTFCTHERRPIFRDPSVVGLVLDQIRFTAAEHDIENSAYCFMPDHLHILVAGRALRTDLKEFARLTKQRSAWRFGRRKDGRLWQAGYYDRVLRDEEATQDVVRYIVGNPVRAGIVTSPSQYLFWGSAIHTREEILHFIQDACQWRPTSGRRRT
jgi:putative transposase